MNNENKNDTNFAFSEVDEVKGKRKDRRRRRRIILIIFGIILAILLYFGLDIYFRLNNMFNTIHQEVPSIDLRRRDNLPAIVLGETPFSVLILGLDGPRSDTMMVATVNPNLGTTYLLSIARDTMVDIPGFWTTRINHAHAYGGVSLSIDTVQNFLDIPIDYYATLHMDGFSDLVDAFGGVTVYNNTVDFSLGGYHFPRGYIDLTGNQALYYVRMRMGDPLGDFGRQERQRDVLAAMADSLIGVSTVTRYQGIMDATSDHMRTDVTLAEMVRISTGYAGALGNITNLNMHYPGRIINGMYLIPIPEESRLAMSNRLRNHLELD